jgi:hypothetical protein
MRRTSLLAAVVGLIVVAGAAGCGPIFNTLNDGVVRDTPMTEVRFSGGSGDVTVLPDDAVKGIDIRRIARYWDEPPRESIEISGGLVRLDADCGPHCTASYEVHAPRGLRVVGDTGSGDVNLRGVSDVDVRVSSGDLSVVDTTGSVRVQVSSGDITLDLPGTANVTVEASSGDVEVRLPNGCCRITASTSSGDERIEVSQGSAAAPLVNVHTSSGDISVLPAGPL